MAARSQSVVPEALLAAYRATTYRIELGRRHINLRIGRRSLAADRWLAAHDARCGAFLTAWNPHSRRRSAADNDAAQRALERDLARLRVPCLRGAGIGADSRWPPERSVFAVGLTRAQARRLATKYRQFAFVFQRRGAPAELVVMPA